MLRFRWVGGLFLIACISQVRATPLELTSASIADLQAAYAAGTLTSEVVVAAYLARIEAFDRAGPAIRAVMALNPHALDVARALDDDRAQGHVRGPLHGIPVVLKDNIDTHDLPTTGGSQLLEGSIPPDAAWVTRRLRESGAIILAKVNLSEWAGTGGSVYGASPEVMKRGGVPGGFSSAGGQTRNPHQLDRSPGGSSGGTGAAIAAAFAQVGLGTDTGGSIRGPSSHNGMVGLKPTHGLVSLDGIIPLAPTFDTVGPMARSVYDVASVPGVLAGVDAADAATRRSEGRFHKDYSVFLVRGALAGKRIGVNRDYAGADPEVDRLFDTAITTLKSLGAEVVDPVVTPASLRETRALIYNTMTRTEFEVSLTEYLRATAPGFPKSFAEVVARSNDPAEGYRSPGKAFGLHWVNQPGNTLEPDDPLYLAMKDTLIPVVKAGIDAVFAQHRLDALVYATLPRTALPIDPDAAGPPPQTFTTFANLTGYPDLIVPAGMSQEGRPVSISFFGPAFSEPLLLGLGFDFEQATQARRLPVHTPPLASDRVGR